MANLATNAGENPVRMMIGGEPGTAKTGALVALVNAGFKLRILDFDSNLEPLKAYCKPEMLANVDAITFVDKMRVGASFMEPIGIPTAFSDALRALDHWRYYTDTNEFITLNPTPGREVTDLGHSKDWGPDTIVVLDSMTAQGEAAFRRAQKLMNKTPANTTQQVWNLAMSEQLNFIKKLTKSGAKHHVIVLAHLKIIAPKDTNRDDSDLTKELKSRLVEFVPTKYFPRALGYELPQTMAGEFPTFIKTESKLLPGNKIKRIIRTQPDGLLDLKVPGNVPSELSIETGLLEIFKVLSPQAVKLVAGNGTAVSAPVATEE